MKTRGYFATFVMFFAITALPFAILMAIITGTPIEVNLISGILFGFLFGLIMASFFKGEKITVSFDNKEKMISKINSYLAEIGYHPETQTETFLTFKPSFQAGLLAGKISILVEENTLTIIGPSTYLKKLNNKASW